MEDEPIYVIEKRYAKRLEEKYPNFFFDPSFLLHPYSKNHKQNLEIFHYLFDIGEDGKVFLWNELVFLVTNEYSKIKPAGLSQDEIDFLKEIHGAIEAYHNKYHTYSLSPNINQALETSRLLLKPYNGEEAETFIAYWSAHKKELEDYAKSQGIKASFASIYLTGPLTFMLYRKKDEALIGMFRLIHNDEEKEAETEYFLFAPYRKQGYGKEAFQALIEALKKKELYLFWTYRRKYVPLKCQFLCKKLLAKISEDNKASIALAKSVGFQFKWRKQEEIIYKKKPVVSCLYQFDF